MGIIRTALLIGVLAFAGAAWAADTDVENPNLRELPLQRGGAIYGGKQHQPTAGEIEERLQEKGPAAATSAPGIGAKPATGQKDPLYDRVLQQSQRGVPRTLDPDK
jgi:hypothetical protein